VLVLDRTTARDDLQAARSRRRRRRTRAVSALHVLFWASVAMPLVLFLVPYDGLSRITDLGTALTAAASVAGMVGTDLVLVMVLLAARVPLLDRVIGHDTAIALHRRLGRPALYMVLAHGALYTLGRAVPDGFDLVGATLGLYGETDLPLAYLALVLFVVVVVSSVVASVHRASYEVWYAIHLLSYVAILFALPHQSVPGGVLAGDSTRYVYWLGLYAVAFGALLVFRVVVPLARTAWHGLRVDAVEHVAPDVVSIHLRGRHLDRLHVAGGQYAVWRFWSRSTWWHAHPLSFSAVPTATGARLTVRTLGAGSARISRVRPGTRVWTSGPLGLFTDAVRTAPRLSLVAAGVGVTPVRALLEDTPLRPGDATVVLRGTDDGQRYLWDEITSLADASGSTVHTVTGPRPAGTATWLSAEALAAGATITTLLPDLLDSDLYVCGPPSWTDEVVRDARAAGLPESQLHVERFDW